MSIYFTVGPSQLYPTVLSHITTALENNIPSISHRSKKFQELFRSTTTNLRLLLHIPQDYQIFFVSSGTEAMERVIQNCVQEKSFHFMNGAFSERFYKTAEELGKKPQKYEVPPGKGFNFPEVVIPEKTELICLTQNETSTGVQIPVQQLSVIKKKNNGKLVALDIVSSAPYVDLDYSVLDCVFFSVQKGFGLPAGLGVVIVSPAAIAKSKVLENEGVVTGSYHRFSELLKYAEKNQTPETPNVLGFYLLNRVVEDMLQKTIHKIRQETDEKAELLYSTIEKIPEFSPLVNEKNHRSNTTIVFKVENGSSALIEYLKTKGIFISSGYKDLKDSYVRIANFPAHSLEMYEALAQSLSHFSRKEL